MMLEKDPSIRADIQQVKANSQFLNQSVVFTRPKTTIYADSHGVLSSSSLLSSGEAESSHSSDSFFAELQPPARGKHSDSFQLMSMRPFAMSVIACEEGDSPVRETVFISDVY